MQDNQSQSIAINQPTYCRIACDAAALAHKAQSWSGISKSTGAAWLCRYMLMPLRKSSMPNFAMNDDSPAIMILSGMARLAMVAARVPRRKQVRFTRFVACGLFARASRAKSSNDAGCPMICEYSAAIELSDRHCAHPLCPETQRGPSGSTRICPTKP